MTDDTTIDRGIERGNGSSPNHSGNPGEQLKQVGRQSMQDAADVGRDAKAHATSLAGEVDARVSAAADDKKADIAGRIENAADAIHRSGEALEGQSDMVAKLIESGADELAALAEKLRSNDLQGLARHVQDFAGRQPALFAGAAIAAGFAAVRFGQVTAAGASRSDLPHAPETPRAR